MKITIPELALVCLIGSSGSGKSSFARAHFLPTEVLSSDACRAMVADDENNQAVSNEAFEILHFIAAKRLAGGRLTVVDATNVQSSSRKPLIALAREQHAIPVAIVLDMPESLCLERNRLRTDRNFGPHVIRRQKDDLRRSLRGLEREGFRYIYVLKSPEEVAEVTIERQPLWCNRKQETGPFDIIGDVHGCADELRTLLTRLGYQFEGDSARRPEGRTAVFLGDLVDRGPDVPGVLRLVMAMAGSGNALCVPGNHDVKLARKLRGKDVAVNHGLAESLAQLESESPEFRRRAAEFLDSLTSHYVLDGGRLVVAHAGLTQAMQGRGSGKVRDFCLYGETTGETDEYGLPVRHNWAAEYRGLASVVYGHTPVLEPQWLNNTIDIDTGCCFGGRLTALRWPEKELVAAPAARVYCEPVRPIAAPANALLTAQQADDDLLDLADVTGRRLLETRLHRSITIREENATAALEVMGRFGANPKWLIYLPPTMSPPETTQEPGYLEHPAEAFAYYRQQGVSQVVCEQKHMGSRTVVILCRDEEVARQRFGVVGEGIGLCYTRTGRPFFESAAMTQALLQRLAAAMERSGLWQELQTDWVALDCELMPWSAKAQELLRQQYAAVGAAGRAALADAVAQLEQAAVRTADIESLLARFRDRAALTNQYVDAYRRYCWPVNGLDDLLLAPFHLLAAEGKVYTDQDHLWHMQTLARLCAADPELLLATPYLTVDLADPASCAAGVHWWEELTGQGGEGMVVKPLSFVTMGPKGLVQPAVKCRGREYLRIIYGPEYTLPANLERLHSRSVGAKRSLALREFALGIESLERFVRHEPLRNVHACVCAVLALESEPVDPRL